MQNKISVTILTKNSSKYLSECLKSVECFDEIIVLDNGSSDNTIEIAKTFANVKIFTSPFIGFGPLKNLAASYASNDWIFSLDSDEVVSEGLRQEILNTKFEEHTIYEFERLNHYDGKIVTCCGWSPDKVLRIYNKNATSYNDAQVHESIIKNNMKIVKIDGKLIHYSFDSVESLLDKLQRYSTLWAEQNRFKRSSSITKATMRSLFAFFKNFILQKGFLCGKEGFLISVCNALGVFFKYTKLAEKNKKLTTSLIITTYNRPDALELVLMSAFAQNELPDEIIIADDGSGEATRLLIEKMQKISPVPLLHAWQEDDGFRLSRSRNNAIKISNMEYIIVVDGDMILSNNFIHDHKNNATKNTYIQGSRVLMSSELSENILFQKRIQISLFDRGIKNKLNAIRCVYLSRLLSIFSKQNLSRVRGGHFSLFREDIYRVNGFDETFTTWGREDSEFVARLLNAGIKRRNMKFLAIMYHIFHNEGKSSDENDLKLEETIKNKKTWCNYGLVVSSNECILKG